MRVYTLNMRCCIRAQVKTQVWSNLSAPQAVNCSLQDVGLGRWTYESRAAKDNVTGFEFREVDVCTARWTPLGCVVPSFTWNPQSVDRCTSSMRINKIVVMGGSTSEYLLTDFKNWLNGTRRENKHTKDRTGGVVSFRSGRSLELKVEHQSSANPRIGGWPAFFQTFHNHTLVLFNSVLWDMRDGDLERYTLEVEGLAKQMGEYKQAHPTNRIIWRASGTPSWERLDVTEGRFRQRERLLNPDSVFVYNTIAARSMQRHGIEVFDDALIALG